MRESARRHHANLPWSIQLPIEGLHPVGRCYGLLGSRKRPDLCFLIETAGLFTTSCRDWRSKLNADKTFPALKIFFRAANLDRSLTATAESAGFFTAPIRPQSLRFHAPIASPTQHALPSRIPTAGDQQVQRPPDSCRHCLTNARNGVSNHKSKN